jgi:hypothetical protein
MLLGGAEVMADANAYRCLMEAVEHRINAERANNPKAQE